MKNKCAEILPSFPALPAKQARGKAGKAWYGSIMFYFVVSSFTAHHPRESVSPIVVA